MTEVLFSLLFAGLIVGIILSQRFNQYLYGFGMLLLILVLWAAVPVIMLIAILQLAQHIAES